MKKLVFYILSLIFIVSSIVGLYRYFEFVPNYSKELYNILPGMKVLGFYVRQDESVAILAVNDSNLGVYLYNPKMNETKPLSEGVVGGIDESKIKNNAKSYSDGDENVYFNFESYLVSISKSNEVSYGSYLPEYIFDDRVIGKSSKEVKLKQDLLSKYTRTKMDRLKISKSNFNSESDIHLYLFKYNIENDLYYTVTINQNLSFIDKDGQITNPEINVLKPSLVYYYEIPELLDVDKEYNIQSESKVNIIYKCYKRLNLMSDGTYCRSMRLLLKKGFKKRVIEAEMPVLYKPFNNNLFVDSNFIYLSNDHQLKLYSI